MSSSVFFGTVVVILTFVAFGVLISLREDRTFDRAMAAVAAAAGLEMVKAPPDRLAEPPHRSTRGIGRESVELRVTRRNAGGLCSFLEVREVTTGGDSGGTSRFTLAFAPRSLAASSSPSSPGSATTSTLPANWTLTANDLVSCIRVEGRVKPEQVPELLDAVEAAARG